MSENAKVIRRIVGAYDDVVVRSYSLVRFAILRQRFLFEIGQYLPRRGRILDVGCGFGLFALYFAITMPGITVRGFDLNPRRIQLARSAARRLGVENVQFEVGDATTLRFDEPLAAAYMLDLIHHIPRASVAPLIANISDNLLSRGPLLVKDIDPTYAAPIAFTWLLDKALDFRAPVDYWPPGRVQTLLESHGLDVHRHRMIDYLPYPHILYIGRKRAPGDTA